MNRPNNLGKTRNYRTPTGVEIKAVVADEFFMTETDYENKLFCFQRLHSVIGEFFRIGYYMWNETHSKWIWGKNAPFISGDDMRTLYKEAGKRNWF